MVKFWKNYKRLIRFPSGTRGWKRTVGVGLYFASAAIGVIFVYLTLSSESVSYIDYKKDKGDNVASPPHQLPDVVVCPARRQDRRFSVLYNEELIRYLNITAEELDKLAEIFHNFCPSYKVSQLEEETNACPWPNWQCGEFEVYCRKAQKLLEKLENNQTVAGFPHAQCAGLEENCECLVENEVLSHYLALRKIRSEFRLRHLWILLIHPHYASAFKETKTSLLAKRNHEISCLLFKDNAEDYLAERECEKAGEDLWVGNSLCFAILGHKMNQTVTPFFGVFLGHMQTGFNPDGRCNRDLVPNVYWIGSLQNNELRESAFATPKIPSSFATSYTFPELESGVVYYSAVHTVSSSADDTECVEQPLIRGLELSCNKGDAWYYEIRHQDRPIDKVWIYFSAVQTIVRKNAYTVYTQFQLATSIFGSLIGLSALQIIEVVTYLLTKPFKKFKKAIFLLKIAFIFALIGVTSYLTWVDMSEYLNTRYTEVFRRMQPKLPVPVVKLCNEPHGHNTFTFINVSKMYEHNISLPLYHYMKLAAFHHDLIFSRFIYKADPERLLVTVPEYMIRHTKPYLANFTQRMVNNKTVVTFPFDVALCNSENFCDITSVSHSPLFAFLLMKMKIQLNPRFNPSMEFDALNKEIEELGKAIGRPMNRLVDLFSYFVLDTRKFVKSCIIRGQIIKDCGKYASYQLETEMANMCIVIRIPESELRSSETQRSAGFENGLEIVFDKNEYYNHSELFAYYGPDIKGEPEFNLNDAVCRYINGSTSIEGFSKTECPPPNSWRLKIQHSTWSAKEAEVRVAPRGPSESMSYAVDIRLSFSKKLAMGTNQSCVEEASLTCKYPKEEATLVMKALQMEILCKCIHCFTQSTSFLEQIVAIVGRKTECCTPKQFSDCYLRYQSRTVWNQTAKSYQSEDESADILKRKLLIPRILSFSNIEFWQNVKVSHLSQNNILWYATKLPDYNAMLERAAAFFRECFKVICDHQTLENMNLQKMDVTDGEMKINIFYVSDTAVGTEEIDRLDAPHLLLVLTCGYGMTIGISFLGLFEILFLFIKKLKTKENQETDEALKSHVMRNLVCIGDIKPEQVDVEVKEVSDAHPDTERSVSATFRRLRVPEVEPEDPDQPCTSTGYHDPFYVPNRMDPYKIYKKSKVVSPNDPRLEEIGVSTNEIIPGYIKKTSPPRRLQDSASHVSMELSEAFGEEEISFQGLQNRDPVREDNGIKNQTNPIPVPISPPEDSKATEIVMTVIFVVLTVVMSTMLVITFMTVQKYEFNAVLVRNPNHQKPSVFICTQTDFARLHSAVLEANCSLIGSKTHCSNVFTTYLLLKRKQMKNLHCLIQDNTGNQRRLNNTEADLLLEIERNNQEIQILVGGLNGTELSDLNPYIQWKNEDVQISGGQSF